MTTLGEAINARARAGARTVEARGNYERVLRTKVKDAIAAAAKALKNAEIEYETAQAAERAAYDAKRLADRRSAFDREADDFERRCDDLSERMIQLRIAYAILEHDIKKTTATLQECK